MARYNRIQDEFTNLPISGQAKWRLRNQKRGRCHYCTRKRYRGAALCRFHLLSQRVPPAQRQLVTKPARY